MAKRELTQAAQAAKLIRKELKKNGIKATVRSKNYSMGSSVNVTLTDELPATFKAVSYFCSVFRYGHFDGMVDMYEYSNARDDIPQAKFVSVTNHFSDEMEQAAYSFCLGYFAEFEGFPENIHDAMFLTLPHSGNVYQFIYQILTGYRESNFWTSRKPRI